MNGLTAEGFKLLIDKLREAAKQSYFDCEVISASEIESIIEMAMRMQNNNTTQASRPDRVGDECWYALWDVDNGRWDWRRGIFRGICDRSYPFVAEDAITKSLEFCLHVNFATEAPK